MKLTKSDILAIPHIKAIGFDGLKTLNIKGLSLDSRTMKPGELFIAIRGDQFDGHNFISKSIEGGAACIIVERRWADVNTSMMVSINIPRLIVENTLQTLGKLANLHRRKFDLPVIAVGGSNGKTTTKEMIRSVLEMKYHVLCTEGNFNNHIGVPQTLFRLEKKHEIAVVEIGTNHPGEIDTLCTILEPTHGLITNIAREHMEFFGTLEGVAKSEGELFVWLEKHHGLIFVNADDKHLVRLSKKNKKTVRFGISAREVSIKGSIESYNADAQAQLRVRPKNKKAFEFTVGVSGEHNAKDALAAAAVGLKFNVPAADIQKALASFQSADKRLHLQRIGHMTVLNDTYNANPDSTLAALATLREMKPTGKKIAVLADMLELGHHAEQLHREIGESASRSGVDILLTFGRLSKSIHDAATVETKAHFENKSALADYLVRTLADGDIVLVKGSRGMKMEEVIVHLSEQLSPKAGA
ncbi:MAG: UDP-N-acetylmuramoyl-tripeptide--D-alanyl-D-alanine ligase [Ignavibacteriae bacterium]|nr:MAG: UDP-N-acetylmuramoyl-tripeptide--D-alanyl-D-alanine ligase [Ignavibacteriota bacterium]